MVWRNGDIDVAVIAIADIDQSSGPLSPVRFGRIEESDGEFPCSALGFPRYKLRKDLRVAGQGQVQSVYRDSAHVIGTANPWSNLREGTLSIRVAPPDRDPDPERSPWEGMSGAAVWSGGLLIGLYMRTTARTDWAACGEPGRPVVGRLSTAQISELGVLIGLLPEAQLTVVRLPQTPGALRDDVLEALLSLSVPLP